MGAKLCPVDFDKIKSLPSINKNLYHEHASVQRRSQSEIDQYLTENEVTLDGENIPRPIIEFKESTYPGTVKLHLLNLYFRTYHSAFVKSFYSSYSYSSHFMASCNEV